MRKLVLIAASLIAMVMMMVSCEDNPTKVGESLVDDNVAVVMDSSFTITGKSELNKRVISRTTTQLLGCIDAKGYGMLRSDIVTQFMPGVLLDTANIRKENIDSIKLVMQMYNGCYTGDSLLPMGVRVYPLTKALPSPMYSDFNPADYYDPKVSWGSAVYSASAVGRPDSISKLNSRNIEVNLPIQLAYDMYDRYKFNPETFQTPQSFAAWFPGLYVANSFGNGRVTRIDKSYITMFYHVNEYIDTLGRDTTYYFANTYLAVTPEIITNNNIKYAMADALRARAEAGEAIIVAPTGYDVTTTFPGREIVEYYKKNSGPISLLNSVTFQLPVENIANEYGIDPPTYILMVKKSKYDEFFLKNMIDDNINAFCAVYDKSTRSYVFPDMKDYIVDLLDGDEVSDEDVDFVITPVSLQTETQGTVTVVTGITPYVTNPVMALLDFAKAKIKLTFTKQVVVL